MSVLFDTALDVFFYFRLGNKTKTPEMMFHYSLKFDREIHKSGQTNDQITEAEVSDGAAKHNSTPIKDEVYVKITHLHPFTQKKNWKSLTSDPTTFERIQSTYTVEPTNDKKSIRIIIISDTHERHNTLGKLPSCDILIHSGDVLMTSRVQSVAAAKRKFKHFNDWMKEQDASHKIVIGGNHDKLLEDLSKDELDKIFSDCTYLCNNSVDVMGLKVWGSPSSQGASDNRAFQSSEFRRESEIAASQAGPIDILVTHGTCHHLQAIIKPRLMHISGHYHCHHGLHVYDVDNSELVSVAAPIMNHKYDPHNLPIMIDCEINDTIHSMT